MTRHSYYGQRKARGLLWRLLSNPNTRKPFLIVVAIVMVVSFLAYRFNVIDRLTKPAPIDVSTITETEALSDLNSLRKQDKPTVGDTYDRDIMSGGGSWGFSTNGCSVRETVLARDLDNVERNGCKVMRGVLHDPYSGKDIEFSRGGDEHCTMRDIGDIDNNGRSDEIMVWDGVSGGCSQSVQIDHIVPAHVAWQKGVGMWEQNKMISFYNDTDNLIASAGTLNNSKSDKDASRWLPFTDEGRCEYAKRYIGVLKKYDLPVYTYTEDSGLSEYDGLVRALSACDAQETAQD